MSGALHDLVYWRALLPDEAGENDERSTEGAATEAAAKEAAAAAERSRKAEVEAREAEYRVRREVEEAKREAEADVGRSGCKPAASEIQEHLEDAPVQGTD